jgi:hypothetical protein
MKHLIAAILLSPMVAGAAVNTELTISGGSMTIAPNSLNFDVSGVESTNFSSQGGIVPYEGEIRVGTAFPFAPGVGLPGFGPGAVNAINGTFLMSLTLDGMPQIPTGGVGYNGGSIEFSPPSFAVTGPGIYSLPFVFGASYSAGANFKEAVVWTLFGQGTMVFDVAREPPNDVVGMDTLYISGAKGSFGVPEPGVATLLLIGLAGLYGQALRRRSRLKGGFLEPKPAS